LLTHNTINLYIWSNKIKEITYLDNFENWVAKWEISLFFIYYNMMWQMNAKWVTNINLNEITHFFTNLESFQSSHRLEIFSMIKTLAIYHFGPMSFWSQRCDLITLIQNFANSLHVLVLTVLYISISFGPKWYRIKVRYCQKHRQKNENKTNSKLSFQESFLFCLFFLISLVSFKSFYFVCLKNDAEKI
jgi:hypothetical protein